MMRNSFVACILTHGRAGRVKTVKALEKAGYTGDILFIVDDEDEQAEEYRRRYGADRVKVFSKAEYVEKAQTGCPSSDIKRGVILYARNACIDVARSEGFEYLIQLDDDYTAFEHREPSRGKMTTTPIKRIDEVFDAMCDFLRDSGFDTVAMAQGGDFIGGARGTIANENLAFLRKAMNSFVMKSDTDFRFVGAINEDVNTYTLLGGLGRKICTVVPVSLVQTQTQKNKGGMTAEYLDDGTAVKSMFSVMMRPDCVGISTMAGRYHHNVEWRYAVPKILEV